MEKRLQNVMLRKKKHFFVLSRGRGGFFDEGAVIFTFSYFSI